MRLEESSFNSSTLKQMAGKPETKTDIQKFVDFETEPKHFQRKPLKPKTRKSNFLSVGSNQLYSTTDAHNKIQITSKS